MTNAKWCCENINSGNIIFKDVISELKELINSRSLMEIKEEFGDVLYFVYCWLYCRFNINLPMIGAMGSIRKFTERLDVWEYIFNNKGLKFDPKYLTNGSNYAKAEKIKLALDMAKKEQRK